MEEDKFTLGAFRSLFMNVKVYCQLLYLRKMCVELCLRSRVIIDHRSMFWSIFSPFNVLRMSV